LLSKSIHVFFLFLSCFFSSGYYCTAGSYTPTQYPSPPGFYSLSGAWQGTPCPAGTYNQQTGQSVCPQCPAGFLCTNVSTISYTHCPPGAYCLAGSATSTPCPAGTYSTAYNLVNVSQCLACPVTRACTNIGLTTVSQNCAAGYYCISGASTASPVDGLTGAACTKGSYCPAASGYPTPCPIGTYQPSTGQMFVGACLFCSPGGYCGSTGLSAVSGPCAAGYFCTGNATLAAPVDGVTGNVCPIGSYCTVGSSAAKVCPVGTFMNVTAASVCYTCPAGFYCGTQTINPVACPAGAFCPAGSNSTLSRCPSGSFNNMTGLSAAADCMPCLPGMFCLSTGLTYPTGSCSPGYICVLGSASATPSTNTTGYACRAGNYCPAGALVPTPCPQGSFNPSTGSSSVAACVICTPGFFCSTMGLSAVSGACAAGFVCTGGAITNQPTLLAQGGFECSTGKFCIGGNAAAVGCAAGRYNDLTGQSACFSCPGGYFCLANSTTFTASPCPIGYACPNGTSLSTQYPCPQGTFGNVSLLTSLSSCIACSAGSYCNNAGQTALTGFCNAGYYCGGSSTSAQPSGTGPNGNCRAGFFCPLGSVAPIPCTGGMYCPQNTSSAPQGYCAAGYYCSGGSSTINPGTGSSGGLCPAGAFCPAASVAPTLCSPGTFAPSSGGVSASVCLIGISGWFYNNSGLSSASAMCTSGMFCPNGTIAPTLVCPAGNMCPAGSGNPVPCAAGTYQSMSSQSSCQACPAGTVCQGLATISPTVCTAGQFCPTGTKYSMQYPCPIGTFSNQTGASNITSCSPSPAGSYCGAVGLTSPSGLCSPGFYCTGGNVASNSVLCPAGFFCPAGSASPTPCPVGTFSPTAGVMNSSGCYICPPGSFCNLTGASAVSGSCEPGFVCSGGAFTSRPTMESQGGYVIHCNYCC
jgi:hypothetical protein